VGVKVACAGSETCSGARTVARARSHEVTVELKPRSGSTITTRLTLRR
jgi:sulfite reductase beta subunit-like hemoprotein